MAKFVEMRFLLVAAVAALALASPGQAGGPRMLVGAAEDVVKQPDLVGAKATMSLLRLAGFDTVRVSVIWAPGERELSRTERTALGNLAGAAQLQGVRVIVSVYQFGSRTTPLTDEAQADFAAFTASIARDFPSFREFIVGNEPNLNRFWLPQFNEDGSNAAAPAYMRLLALTYDELKAVSPRIVVIGGALSPRGIDRPGSGRDTHSPTKFIRDLGTAYRMSGRPLPIMDQLAFHPYPDNSSQPPANSAHPNTTSIGLADYGKLVALLAEAFDGTAQPGSSLPILYAEYGIESLVPPEKDELYTGVEPATTRPVDEATQAAHYRQAIEMAFCQRTVRGLLIFHVVDEPGRLQWQSGVFYADRSPKSSLRAVAAAASASRRGVVARCEGLALTPRATALAGPRGPVASGRTISFRLQCDIDCAYVARLQRLSNGVNVMVRRGRATGGRLTTAAFARRPLPAGRYRIRVEVLAPVNPGPPGSRVGSAFSVVR
jgi:hypothetical protein